MCGLCVAKALGGEPEVVHGAHLALAHEGLPELEGVPEGASAAEAGDKRTGFVGAQRPPGQVKACRETLAEAQDRLPLQQ